jgi:hypothetical protein
MAWRTAVMRLFSAESENDAPFPDGRDQIVVADHTVAVAHQEFQNVEDLRLDRDGAGTASQFPTIGIKAAVIKHEFHSAPTFCRRGRKPRKSKEKIEDVQRTCVRPSIRKSKPVWTGDYQMETTMMTSRGCLIACAMATLGLTPFCPASAQVYPRHPITIVVPFAAGKPADFVARILGDRMSATLGQPIIVENVPGAGGTTGVHVAKLDITGVRIQPCRINHRGGVG